MKFFYLAGPYSHPDPDVRAGRELHLTATVARLLERYPGTVGFSPITHGHRIAPFLPAELHEDHSFWLRQCDAFLALADTVFVLQLPGWEESKGVCWEIDRARQTGKRIFYLQPVADTLEEYIP